MTAYFSSVNDPKLVQLLQAGGVGVLPTDTVYGLVACASSPAAVAKLYTTKFRDSPPGTMIGASSDDFVALGFPKESLQQVAHMWPAPLSVVLDASDVAPYLKQQRTSLPVRVPAVTALAGLLHQTGPLMTTSANAHDEPTSTTIAMAKAYFGESIDFCVDGGDLSGRPSSTIIRVGADNAITVLREGAFKIDVDI